MFEPHTKEAMENEVDIIEFTFKAVRTAVQLCYYPLRFSDIDLEDKMELLQFCDKYNIHDLKVSWSTIYC